MTGAEHYRTAEALLDSARVYDCVDSEGVNLAEYDGENPVVVATIAAAQVHATLALFDHAREIGNQLDARDLRIRSARA